MAATTATGARRRSKGFRQAGALVEQRIRKAGEARGFAVARLLTHWEEIVGEDTASICRPVEVSYGRGGFGATLVLLTTGPNAPVLQMQEARLKERINACYGYAAISRIRITQTAPVGFAEGRASFDAPQGQTAPQPEPEQTRHAAALTTGVGDEGLRRALETLGAHVLTKSARTARSKTERQT